MATKNVYDQRVKDARRKLIATRNAYKAAERERDELIVKLHNNGEYSIEALSDLFQVKQDKISWLVNKPAPGSKSIGLNLD